MLAKLTNFSKQHVFFTESLLVAATMVVGKALSLGWKMLVAQQGAAVMGEIEIILTTTSLLAAIAIQGLPMAITIWTAKLDDEPALRTRVLLQTIFFSIISGGILTLIALKVLERFPYLIGVNDVPATSYLWTVPIMAVGEIMYAWFNGRKKYTWYAFGRYVGQPFFRLVGYASLTILSFPITTRIPWHLNAAVVVTFAIVCLPLFFDLKTVSLKAINSIQDWASHNKLFWWQSLALSGSLLLYVIYTASDVYWLAHFHTPTMVGIFSLSLALISLLELVFMPVLNLLQTRLSHYRQSPTEAWQFTLRHSFLTATVGALAGLGILIAKPWLVLLFGKGGETIFFYHIFWLILWKLIANVLVLPIRHYLDFFDHQRMTLLSMLICFVVKLSLSWWFVPLHGISGIILANLAAEGLHAVLLFLIVWRYQSRNSL